MSNQLFTCSLQYTVGCIHVVADVACPSSSRIFCAQNKCMTYIRFTFDTPEPDPPRLRVCASASLAGRSVNPNSVSEQSKTTYLPAFAMCTLCSTHSSLLFNSTQSTSCCLRPGTRATSRMTSAASPALRRARTRSQWAAQCPESHDSRWGARSPKSRSSPVAAPFWTGGLSLT